MRMIGVYMTYADIIYGINRKLASKSPLCRDHIQYDIIRKTASSLAPLKLPYQQEHIPVKLLFYQIVRNGSSYFHYHLGDYRGPC